MYKNKYLKYKQLYKKQLGGVDNISIYQLNQQFYHACRLGNVDVVRQLLTDPRIDPRENYHGAIRITSERGHIEVLQLLLADPRVDPSANLNEAIHVSSYYGHVETVRMLLADPRVDPSANNNIAIQEASEQGHIEVVQLLLADPRVDPSAYDNEALRVAYEHHNIEVVQLLLQDPRVDPNILLGIASETADRVLLRLLLLNPRFHPSALQINNAINELQTSGNNQVADWLEFARRNNYNHGLMVTYLNNNYF